LTPGMSRRAIAKSDRVLLFLIVFTSKGLGV
jgi:hypothetical protein